MWGYLDAMMTRALWDNGGLGKCWSVTLAQSGSVLWECHDHCYRSHRADRENTVVMTPHLTSWQIKGLTWVKTFQTTTNVHYYCSYNTARRSLLSGGFLQQIWCTIILLIITNVYSVFLNTITRIVVTFKVLENLVVTSNTADTFCDTPLDIGIRIRKEVERGFSCVPIAVFRGIVCWGDIPSANDNLWKFGVFLGKPVQFFIGFCVKIPS